MLQGYQFCFQIDQLILNFILLKGLRMSSLQNKKENYQIISLIGQGAYGQVYKARKKFTGQFVAIKSIKKKGKSEKDIKAMRQEIEILKKLKHENIILLLDSFESQTEFILVTELGQGQLFNIIEDDQSLQIQQIRRIAQQLVRALHYIHSNRITHRDMKPQNILMTSDGVIKLCDFGFARSMSYKTEVLTSLKGTPLYMAPEVVKEEPYNHTADLWSLGVILYQLATGNPPFTASNLISLVEHISKDPILYPEFITGDFKNFLKGLLNKDPKKRLGWPELLHHPFIKETQIEKNQRMRKAQKLSSWIQQNVITQEQQGLKSNPNGMSSKYIPGVGYDDKFSKDVSPRKQAVSGSTISQQPNDSQWSKYLLLTSDEKGCQQLRSDNKFLQTILSTLQTGINQIIRVKQKRHNLHICLKTLIQVLMKSKSPQIKKLDIAKNSNIPSHVLAILKSLLKIQLGKQYIEMISEILKLIGLLARITFQKNLGIEMVYIRSFIPLFPIILKSIYLSKDTTCINNFLRTVGIFANNASANHIRSFSFYKDVVEIRLIPQSIQILRHFQDNLSVLKLYVQVLSALIHPVFGDIQCFPWKKKTSSGISEFKEFLTMSECIRQSIIHALLQASWTGSFDKILQLEDQSAILPKISISRIILQSIRLSKDFTEVLLNNKQILKKIIETLSNKDYIIYSTTCCILVQCIKYMKQKQRQNLIFKELGTIADQVQLCLKNLFNSQGQDLNKISNSMLGIHGSFLLFYEILGLQNIEINAKITNFLNNDKVFQLFAFLISEPEKNKLQEMRKIQGSNYGIHTFGLYDSCFLLLHRLHLKLAKDPNPQISSVFLNSISKSRISQRIGNLVKTLSSKTDISPRGFVACLIFIGDLVNIGVMEDFVEESFVNSLIYLMGQSQIEGIVDWPQVYGGGQNCLTILFGNLSIIILNLLRNSQKYPQIPKYLYESNLVKQIVLFAKHFNEETIISVISILSHLLVLDKIQKNDKMEKTFSKQFISANGINLFSRFNLLNKEIYESSALIDSCNFLSLLARASKQFYENIDSIIGFDQIMSLLSHPDPQLRAKVLNLIGNLCRHSSYFYKKLSESGILTQCIKLCEDQDKTVKKFACVVLGNASFHDDSLYEALRPTIPILINLIKDSEEKTRSNAAAALGNLARNSILLDKEFVKHGVNFQLINLVLNEKSVSCKKVCVMAIMNLLSLPESRKILESQNIETILKKFIPPTYNGDASLIKACQKALQKLQKKISQS